MVTTTAPVATSLNATLASQQPNPTCLNDSKTMNGAAANVASHSASQNVAVESVTPTFVPRSTVPQPVTSAFGDISQAMAGQRLERLVELSDEEVEAKKVRSLRV
jgi:hypothetical protein